MPSPLLSRLSPELQSTILNSLRKQERQFLKTPIGIEDFDREFGGFPQGAITEIYGSGSCGQSGFLLTAIHQWTQAGEICAYVDATNAFDVECAAEMGIDLERLLWIQCGGDWEVALKAADLLCHSHSFGSIILDIKDIPDRFLNRIPASYWHKLRLSLEGSRPMLVVSTPDPLVRASAELCIRIERSRDKWGKEEANIFTGWKCELIPKKPAGKASIQKQSRFRWENAG
jgi:hypothetical protein